MCTLNGGVMRILNREDWRRLSPWLDDLLDSDDATRARKLAELRASDAPLASELELMLQASRRATMSGFLDGSAQDRSNPTPSSPGRCHRN